jgi:hypothetical protein
LELLHPANFENFKRITLWQIFQLLHGQHTLFRDFLGKVQAVRSEADIQLFKRL